MKFEAELKAPCIDCIDKIKVLNAKFIKEVHQHDTYYSHPCRDFKETDEAFRIRKEERLYVTYKGPKKEGDLKIRKEIEFEVGEDIYLLLESLGFTKAFEIIKKRQVYEIDGLILCCDNVEGLGQYLEVEAKTEKDNDKIMDVFKKLGLEDETTVKSYSELLGL